MLLSLFAAPCPAVIIAYVKCWHTSFPLWLKGLDTFWSSSGLTPDTVSLCTSLCKGSQWQLKRIHLPWHTNTRRDRCWVEGRASFKNTLELPWTPLLTIIQICWFQKGIWLVVVSCSRKKKGSQAGKMSPIWPLEQTSSPCVLLKSLCAKTWNRRQLARCMFMRNTSQKLQ